MEYNLKKNKRTAQSTGKCRENIISLLDIWKKKKKKGTCSLWLVGQVCIASAYQEERCWEPELLSSLQGPHSPVNAGHVLHHNTAAN